MKFKEGDIVQVRGAYPSIGRICGNKEYEALYFIIYDVQIIECSLFETGDVVGVAEEFLMEYDGEI